MPISSFSDKKFLVVMLKDGGEDSYHTVISRQPAHVAATQALRPTIGFSTSELEGTYAASRLAGTTFSLHPALQSLQSLWNSGDMAITHRVGPMFSNIADIPIADIRAATSPSYVGNILLPLFIGAHDKQAFGSASMITREFVDQFGVRRMFAEDGFLGRLASRFTPFAGSSTIPMALVSGFAVPASLRMVTDETSRPLTLPLVGRPYRRSWADGPIQPRVLARLDAVMSQPRTEPRAEAFRKATIDANESVAFFQPVIEGGDGAYAVDADFPGNPTTGWLGTMRTFARTIEADMRAPALRNRTVLVGAQSGYDTHHTQGKASGRLATLHADWAASVVCFKAAMVRLGMWNKVLMMDHSEFSRSLRENGLFGTDHAYARDAFAFGGSIRGRGRDGSSGLFGTYPAVLSATGTGSFDLIGGQAAGGSLAPGIALEQQWDEALRWFGADNADIADVLPRRSAYGNSVNLVI